MVARMEANSAGPILALLACLTLFQVTESFSPIPAVFHEVKSSSVRPSLSRCPAHLYRAHQSILLVADRDAHPQSSKVPPLLSRHTSFPLAFQTGSVPGTLLPEVKRTLPRSTRAVERVRELARVVAAVKQEISRRDVFREFAKKLTTSCILLPAMMTQGSQKAYGEAVAAAADKCPDLKELGKKSRTPDFSEDLYSGIWYELAYHDVTQANYFCGCTRFNFTKRSSTFIEDMFTTTCPMTGVLPGEEVAKSIYTLNMTIQYNAAKPGEFLEKGFAYNFPNVVLFIWTKAGPDGKMYYDRALQMQCVEAAGKILFVGINFLARSPSVPKPELDEMFNKAQEIGIDKYGGDRAGMYMVVHAGCKYPVSTDSTVMGPRSDFPGPLTQKVETYTFPDRRVDIYHKF